MKKLTIVLVAFISLFAIFMTGCARDKNTIRLSEVTHSLFYAPLYVAINNGYFKDEGLKIQLTNAGGSDVVITSVISNNADIGLLGPEGVVYTRNGGLKNAPKIFAQLTNCDGSFLMGRSPITGEFDWTSLRGSHVIAGRPGGMPAMTLQYILESYGLKLGPALNANVDTIFDLSISFNMTAVAFIESVGDYATMFEPTASSAVANNQAYILASLGEEVPNVPYTVFTASGKYLQNNEEQVKKFMTALQKGHTYLMDATDAQIISGLKKSFSTTDDSLIISAVRNYMGINAYAEDFVLSETSWNKLLEIMDNAGKLEAHVAWSDAVDNTYASELLSA